MMLKKTSKPLQQSAVYTYMNTNEANDNLQTAKVNLTQTNVIDILEAFDQVRRTTGVLFQSELSIVRRLRDIALAKDWLSDEGKAWIQDLSHTLNTLP